MSSNDRFVVSAAYHYLRGFAVAMHPDYEFASHNRLIIDKLESVERGDIKKLMINISPRAGKSMLSSELFPAWYLGRNPTKNIISVSYGQELADTFGRKVRNIFKEETYQAIFKDIKLAEDSASIKKFSLNKGGGYYATGVMGALSGKGSSCLILDDTLRNRADANSPTIKRNLIEWYKSTAYTRLTPDGAVIILNTRWAQDDLCGHLLETEDDWEVINIPAINSKGESYWPDRWPLERLEEIKKTIGTFEWSALYMQEPVPQGGGMFKYEWFEIVDAAPAKTKKIRYWDRAATVPGKNTDPDYTVGLLLSRDRNNVYYIEDLVRFRGSSLEVQNAILNTASRDGKDVKIGIEQDPGQAGKSEAEYLIRLLTGYNVHSYPVSKSKVTRAGPVSAQCEAGNVKLVKGRWNNDFLDEVCSFPYGKHDDVVDSLSGSFTVLSQRSVDYNILGKL